MVQNRVMKRKIILIAVLFSLITLQLLSAQKPVDTRPSEKEVMLEKLFIEATREKILGNKQEALSRYREVLEKDPKNAMAAYEIATVHNSLNEFEKAYSHAEMAVNLDKKSILYVDFFARLLVQKAEHIKAAGLYSKLIELHPNEQRLYYEAAAYWAKAGNVDQAIKILGNLEKKIGINPEIFDRKYKLYMSSGKEKKALQELELLIERYPKETVYALQMAEHYKNIGKTAEARKYYEKVLQAEPTNPRANIEMADIFRQEGDTLRYITALGSVFVDSRQAPDAKLKALEPLVANVLNQKNLKFETPLFELAQKLVTANPDFEAAYLPLGKMLMKRGNYAEAFNAFDKIITTDKAKIEPWILLMETALKSAKGNMLLKKSEEFADLYPGQAQSQYYRAVALNRCGDYQNAVKFLKRASDMSLGDELLQARIKTALGEAYRALGDPKADALFKDAEKLAAKDELVQMHRAAAYLNSAEAAKADEIINILKASDENNLTVLSMAARVLYLNAKYGAAKEACEKILNNGALNDPYTLEIYGDVHFRLNDIEAAVLHWKQAMESGCATEKLKLKIDNKKPE